MRFGAHIRNNAARLTATAIALLLFGIARATGGNPAPADTAIQFEEISIGAPERAADRLVRPVNPNYARIRGWISAVGAGVSLADIDGDGLPNDLCLVDPRDDSVRVMPVPGTGSRFSDFNLQLPSSVYPAGTVAPMGCLPGDFNEDGRTDLLVYFWGRPPLISFREDATLGPDRFRAVPLVAAHEPWFTNAATQADVDGDGHADLLFGNYFPEEAAVLDAGAAAGGMMQRSMSRARNGGRNRLFLHESGNGTASGFTDHSSALSAGTSDGWTLALGAADLDGDLLPEIYVANDFGSDELLVNLSRPGLPRFRLALGERGFLTPRSRTLGRDSFKGMGAELADLTGDGQLDIAVSNIAQDYALLESHFLFVNKGRPELLKAGIAGFRDESGPRGTARNGWGWDIKAADFDNDGRPELMQALGFLRGSVNRWPELQELATANDDLLDNPAFWPAFSAGADLSGDQGYILYSQDASGVYRDVARAAGLREGGVWRGIAIADVDLDGRLDAAVARQWGQSAVLLNRIAKAGAFLSLDLRLPNANGTSRPAIGAVARVQRTGRPPLIAVVDGGNGHSGKRAPILHFGLGGEREPVKAIVEWRNDGRHHRQAITLKPGHHRILLAPRPGA